jgi:hypothetical protein
MSDLGKVLSELGAVDEQGHLRTDRFEGATGQWFEMAVDPDGLPAAFWTAPDAEDPRVTDDAFRDEQGMVLTGLILLPGGRELLTPLDASLRPLVQVSMVLTGGKTISANPGGWPLTEEELDREQPPPPPDDWPRWRKQAYEKAAKDRLGRPFSTRVQAADGGWADALMDPNGQVVSIGVEPSELGQVGENLTSATVIRGPAGRVVLVRLEDGRPALSRQALDQREPGATREGRP